MRRLALVLVTVSSSALPGVALAQSYSASSSYANPDSTTTEVVRRRGPCADPWVTMALERVYGAAERSKCDISLYNNGRWSDFNQLVHAVAKVRPVPVFDLTVATFRPVNDTAAQIFDQSGRKVGELSNGSFTVDPSYTRLVAAGGGNLIGNDGSTLVAAGGGNLVGNDGASLIESKLNSARLTSGGASYALQAVTSFKVLKASTRRR